MSDYLFLVNIGDGIVNSVCLSKFPSNNMSQSKGAAVVYKVGAYTQSFESTIWKKIDEVEFNNDNNITLNSSDYNLGVGQLVVVIPADLDTHFKNEYIALPEPISRKIDLAPVSERASISFTRGNSFSSYQGEFPYQMSRIKGSFLAFDSLAKDYNKNVKTKIILINIYSGELTNKQLFSLDIADINSKRRVASEKYVHNSAGIVDIEIVENSELCFYSKDTLGIPIFISYNDVGYLSIEHTHPPASYFRKNSAKGQKLLKRSWLPKLP